MVDFYVVERLVLVLDQPQIQFTGLTDIQKVFVLVQQVNTCDAVNHSAPHVCAFQHFLGKGGVNDLLHKHYTLMEF